MTRMWLARSVGLFVCLAVTCAWVGATWLPTDRVAGRLAKGPAAHAAVSWQLTTPTPRTDPPPAGTPTSTPGALRPDLTIRRVDTTAVDVDPQTLEAGGIGRVVVANRPAVPISDSFRTAFFEDRDLDGRLSVADRELGAVWTSGLGASQVITLSTMLSGSLQFAGNRISVAVDASGDVAESDELYNVAHDAPRCEAPRMRGGFDPKFAPNLAWRWPSETSPLPRSVEVEVTPIVLDLDGDGLAEIIFITRDPQEGKDAGRLRAVSGADGRDVFAVTAPQLQVYPFVAPAVGDIDADGRPDIVALARDRVSAIAFNHQGNPKWRAPISRMVSDEPGVTLADVDGDGRPEVMLGGDVMRGVDGFQLATGPPGILAADIDRVIRQGPVLRPGLELLSGPAAWRAGGGRAQFLWRHPELEAVSWRHGAIADMDGDGDADLVDVLQDGGLVVIDAASGAEILRRPFPFPRGQEGRQRGGPVTIADLDGDGHPDAVVAGRRRIAAFLGPDLRETAVVSVDPDNSLGTGVSAFDVDGDGRHELAYTGRRDAMLLGLSADRDDLVLLWRTRSESQTLNEMPIFADIDADGRAEMVLPTGVSANRDRSGLRAYGNPGWGPARPVWNQHAFHGTHVTDEGVIPRLLRPSWREHNTFRAGLPPAGRAGDKPDLAVSRIEVHAGSTPGPVEVSARLGNGGRAVAVPGIPVLFREVGQPSPFARIRTDRSIPPGAFVVVTATLPMTGERRLDLEVVANPTGDSAAAVTECERGAPGENNVHRRSVAVRFFPSPTPTSTRTPTPTATPTAPATASATASPTGMAPRRVFLPVAFGGPCNRGPALAPLDIVVVIDVSASTERDARRRMEEAVRAIVAGASMAPSGGRDRVGIVAFSDRADVHVPLTDDPRRIATGISSLPRGFWSRLDLGLLEAGRVLSDARRDPGAGAISVVVPVTDGRIHPAGPPAARSAAAQLHELGVHVVPLSVGHPDDAVLRSIASERGGVDDAGRIIADNTGWIDRLRCRNG